MSILDFEVNTKVYGNDWLSWKLKKESEREQAFWKPELDYFLSRIQNSGNWGHLLEIGPGAFVEALYLMNNGLFEKYTGLEPSEALRNHCEKTAKENEINAILRDVKIQDLAVENIYDNFFTIASLNHVFLTRISRALRAIYHACKPNALGLIILEKSPSNKAIRKNSRGAVFCHYEFTTFKGLLEKHGFEVTDESKEIERVGRVWQVFNVKNAK